MGGCAWILCRSPIVAHHGSPAAQQCTQTPQTGAESPDPPICVHYRGHAGSPAAQQCTQTPQFGAERPSSSICVHYCDPKATHNPSPQPNSVHKRPNPARRGPILPSVYTIAAPRGYPRHNSVHKRPKPARRAPILSSVYTIWPPGAAHGSIVYTNAPKIQQKSHREFGTSSHLSCPSKNAAILSNGMASFPPPS